MKKIVLTIVMLIAILTSNAQVFNDINKKLNVNPFSPFVTTKSYSDTTWIGGIEMSVIAQDKIVGNFNVGMGLQFLMFSEVDNSRFKMLTMIPIELNYRFPNKYSFIPFVNIGPIFNTDDIDIFFKSGFRIVIANKLEFGNTIFDCYLNFNYLYIQHEKYNTDCLQIGMGFLF